MESLKSAIATIKKNRDVFIFPEGTRSLDGEPLCGIWGLGLWEPPSGGRLEPRPSRCDSLMFGTSTSTSSPIFCASNVNMAVFGM